jgi:hypothetical protein
MNPKMPLILLVSFLSTFAACSKESAPRPSDTAPPAQATSPAQAPSPTPLPAASTPPPPAGPVLQSQDTNTAGIVSDFTECKRKEGVLGVKVRFRNVSSPEKYFNIISGRNYDHFYVTAANKKYFILKDSEGTYLTPSASGGGDLRVPLEQGARSVIRLIFFTSAGGAGYFAHHVYCRPCSSRDIQTVKESIFTI